MAPSQTTTSPRRLRKQAEREAKRDKLLDINYQMGVAENERYVYWLTFLEKEYPQENKEKIRTIATQLARRNRAQRRGR